MEFKVCFVCFMSFCVFFSGPLRDEIANRR